MVFFSKIKYLLKFTFSSLSQKLWPFLHRYSDLYEIPGTSNLNRNLAYTDSRHEPNFQELLIQFKCEILEGLNYGSPKTYFKFGDGDFYFLNGIGKGSAEPGRRAISRPLTFGELQTFRRNSQAADRYLCELAPENKKMFRDIFSDKKIDFPAELVYGLIANRWLLKIPNCRIGLIGASEKLSLIEHLLEFPEYRDYLGVEKFHNYVHIPQKFACDNLSERLIELKASIQRLPCDLYLMGIGHLKSGVISELSKYSNSIFLDVGSGIDALAGIIDRERPYFGNWINFRSRSYDYSNLDLLQYKKSRIKYLN